MSGAGWGGAGRWREAVCVERGSTSICGQADDLGWDDSLYEENGDPPTEAELPAAEVAMPPVEAVAPPGETAAPAAQAAMRPTPTAEAPGATGATGVRSTRTATTRRPNRGGRAGTAVAASRSARGRRRRAPTAQTPHTALVGVGPGASDTWHRGRRLPLLPAPEQQHREGRPEPRRREGAGRQGERGRADPLNILLIGSDARDTRGEPVPRRRQGHLRRYRSRTSRCCCTSPPTAATCR